MAEDLTKIYDDIYNKAIAASRKKFKHRRKRPGKPTLLNPHRKYHEESVLYKKRMESFSKPTDHVKKILSDEHKLRISHSLRAKWVLVDPKGRLHRTGNLKSFCRKHRLSYDCLSKVARGLHQTHQGWICRKIDSYGENLKKLLKNV